MERKPTKKQLEFAQRFKNRVAQRLRQYQAEKQVSQSQGKTGPTPPGMRYVN